MKIVLNDYFTLGLGKIGYLTPEDAVAFAVQNIKRKIVIVGQIFNAVNGSGELFAVNMLCIDILCDAKYVTIGILDFILP